MLDILVDEKRIDPETKKLCLKQKHNADSWRHTLVNCMIHGKGDRFIFISVWDGNVKYYSRVGRVLLTFDKKKFDLICGCSHSSRINCNHKPIAKWFLRSTYSDIFLASSESLPPTRPLDSGIVYSQTVEYQLKLKKIPFDIPQSAKKEIFSPGIVIVPKEDICFHCNEKLTLKECGGAKLLTRFGVVNIANVWMKCCIPCSIEFHYCEVIEGIFNFENKFFMSFDLLVWLQNAIFEHTALSREIKLIEKRYEEKINHDVVRRCFYKFLALIDYKEKFRCFLCGDHPVVLTFDTNRKCAFKMENKNVNPPKSEKVDLRKFWDGICKEAISGSISKFVPSLEFWAPFIGKNSKVVILYIIQNILKELKIMMSKSF